MKKYKSIIIWTLAAIAFGTLLYLNDAYAFQFMEQRHTFYADQGYISYTLSQLGGLALLLSDFIQQFFLIPFAGILINALLLTLGSFLSFRIFSKFSQMRGLELISMIPFLAYAVQMSDMNFQYFGFISHIMATAALAGFVKVSGSWKRLAYALAATVILFALCGAAAMLFAVTVVVLELFRDPKRAALYLAAPLLACAAGVIAYRAGSAGSLRHVMTPHAYFTLRLQVGERVWLSWGSWGAVLGFACLSGLLRYRSRWSHWLTSVLSTGMAAAAAAFFLTGFTSRADILFKELSVSASRSDWDHIIENVPQSKMNNLLFQNYLNVALAEKGLLAERLLREPVQSIRSIFVETNKTPYVSVMLSDVFYSMGQMGLAQRYAFEGNEGWGSYSPRMYKRLVITNMAYGAYPVAQKYLSLLKSNIMHRGWAVAHEELLGDEEAVMADAEIASARRCIFPDNKLSGLNGLDEDLMRVIKSNPEHKSTVQYLGCLYLLLKDKDSFLPMLDECISSGYISLPLPTMFQEAVLQFCGEDENTVAKYGLESEILKRHQDFAPNPRQQRSSYWYYHNYQ